MFSGKSTELLRQINRDAAIGRPFLAVNHALDCQRYQTAGVSTHKTAAGHQVVDALVVDRLLPLLGRREFADCQSLYVNEAQFFPDLLDFARRVLRDHPEKRVVLSGLDGDSEQKPFEQVVACVPLADSVMKLLAQCVVCRDGTLAPFTVRRRGTSETRVQVGGADIYKPVCRMHLSDLS
jgi:thymidine kinase